MEPSLCHPSGIQNFDVSPRFLENLGTHMLNITPRLVLLNTGVNSYVFVEDM